MDLNINNIIWSKGPIRNDYSNKQTKSSSSSVEIINIIKSVTEGQNIVFIRNGSDINLSDLQLFADNLHLLKIPIILITSDGDRSMPSTHNINMVNKLLMSDMIIRWYTQNYDKSIVHPKITHFPIGFDLHTCDWLVNNSVSEKIKHMINTRRNSPTDKRISNKILSDMHLTISHPERRRLHKLLLRNKNINFVEKRISFVEITEEYSKYNFVLSPRGNGLDCHRTWELFLNGVIIITQTSSLNEMYTKNNLPVVILKNWSELNNNLGTKLKKWYKTYIDKTSIDNIFPRLTFDYWLKT